MTTEEFAAAFIGRLARDDFHAAGSLTAYLALPEAGRTGDEADIVDNRVTRALIAALGYAEGEATYNRGKDQQRPDYTLAIHEYPGLCLVIEDKATTERALEKHRPQLAAYMAGLRCPRGLLINAETLLAYEATGPSAAAALRFSIAAAVRLWRGEDLLAGGKTGWEALSQPERDALAVTLRRYGRPAFASVSRLIEDLTLDAKGVPHALDGSSWRNGLARIPITDVRDAPDHLVRSIQELIVELREDVAVQFAVHQADHAAFLREIEMAPGSRVAAATLMDELETSLTSFLPGSAKDRGESLRVMLRQAMTGGRPIAEIDGVEAEIRSIINGRAAGGRGDALQRAASEARNFANRYAMHRNRAAARHEAALAAMEAHQKWRASLGVLLDTTDEARALDEYFAQTAYVIIVRMLLIRILEDKGLTNRIFTNGGAALWFGAVEERFFSLSIGRSAARLLEIAYENAQATYAHFYDGHRVFDWYVPDRSMLVRVLHRLAGFDLKEIDRDIIGTVYGRFVNDRHKHEQGMYYTPPQVVGFILDRVGWQGRDLVGRRLLDPACGSGAFLVEAARRALEAHRAQARAEGHAEIPAGRVQAVLDSLRDGLVGFDLNPFACALAEINLLVQVLEPVAHAIAAGYPIRMDRFRIYNTDGLRPSAAARAVYEEGLDPAEAEDLPDEEQAKLALGSFAGGFDVVVANPPYVRADEGSAGQRQYRAQISAHPMQQVRDVLTQKWDLFIPFVALGRQLLRQPAPSDAGGGRMGMIVSNALETVLYARGLREQLAAGTRLHELHFFEPRVKLFDDAAVRNTILIAEAGLPGPQATTLREWHGGPPPAARRRQSLPQVGYGAEVFRPALPALRVAREVETRLLRELCYVSVGMVLNAHERLAQGSFTLDDLLSSSPDSIHCRPYVGSEDLRLPHGLMDGSPFAPMRIQYLEYGTDRVPSLIRRATFPELYDRPKIMVGEFGGTVLDDGDFDPAGFLACNHSVFLFLRWRELEGVRNRSLRDRLRDLGIAREELEAASDQAPLPYLAGLLNSATWQTLLSGAATTSIAGRAQPVNFADQPIPLPTAELAADIGREAEAARSEGRALAALLRQGWRRRETGWLAPAGGVGATQPLAVARTRWGLSITNPNARCDRLRREGHRLVTGAHAAQAASLPETLAPEAMDYLLRLLLAQGRATLQSAENEGLRVILDPAQAAAAERQLVAAEAEALRREERILTHRAAIDDLLVPLFEAIPHPATETIEPAQG